MSAPGTVLFSASEGYDEDMWDDSALIQQYDRALQASRELIRKRQSVGEKKKKRNWNVGDMCRAVYSEDGIEYEGTVVFSNKANKSVTVRFFGYNNEEEVKERDLMESLGQDEIQAQIEQAKLDLEEEEEEEGAGDDYRLGDWCRAEWSEDGIVYEAEVLSVDRKKRTAEVKFVGFGNKEVKHLDDLFMSKGEERRIEQELQSKESEVDLQQDLKDDDIDNLLIKNCPDLLRNFGDDTDFGLENLSLDEKAKKKAKKDKKEKKPKKEKNAESDIKIKTEVDSNSSLMNEHLTSSFPNGSFMQMPQGFNPPPAAFNMMPPQMPSPFPSMQFPFPAMQPSFPPIPSPFSSIQSPYMAMQPPMMLPPNLPQPPSLPTDLKDSLTPELHSLLLSWYLAGYHTGVYQGISQTKEKKKSKKK